MSHVLVNAFGGIFESLAKVGGRESKLAQLEVHHADVVEVVRRVAHLALLVDWIDLRPLGDEARVVGPLVTLFVVLPEGLDGLEVLVILQHLPRFEVSQHTKVLRNSR